MTARAADVEEVTGDMVALHGTDPASVYLAAWARMRNPDVTAIERALYERRTLVRMLGMRRTMFIVPVELVPVVHCACTEAIARRERHRFLRMIEQSGIVAGAGSWLRRVEEATVQALEARGEATAAELSRDVPELRLQVPVAVGTKWEGVLGVSTRVLFLLAAEGRVVRGRPRGSWTSTQYAWAPMRSWLPGDERAATLTVEAARVKLVQRWLAAFGPGTVDDIKWWTGLTLGEVRRALKEIGTVDVDLDGRSGLVLEDDVEVVRTPDPWVALLPALDPTVMGWTERTWFLGRHGPALFDRSGNPGPTVWWDGRIVGGWAQRKDGEIAYRLLEDAGAGAVRAVEAAAGSLGAWLGEVRVTPRFRTPLERELAG